MMRSLPIVAALFLLAAAASAQTGGTVESRFGIGELAFQTSGRGMGMGAVSAPLRFADDVNSSNPAAWSSVNELRLQGGVSYDYVTFSNNSAEIRDAIIEGFQLVFPAEDKYRTRFVAGLMPVSRSYYDLVAYGKTSLDEPYTIHYRGSGGLSLFRFGASVQPLPFLQIGAAYQYYFGTIEQEWEATFSNDSYYPSFQQLATSHSGSAFLLGFMLEPVEGLSVGGSLNTAAALRTSQNMKLQFSTQDSILTGASGTRDYPLQWQAGIGYQLLDQLLVAADYSYQDWTNATEGDGQQSSLTSTYKLGAGLEWFPWKGDIASRSLSQLAIRFGFFHKKNYVAVGGVDVKEYMFTTGFGFPIFGSSRGDIALQYGWQGSAEDRLGRRDILRLVASISFGEKWFTRDNTY